MKAAHPIMAGLSFMTAFNLKHSEPDYVVVTHAGPDEKGLYAGWITNTEGRPVVSGEHQWGTPEEAEQHMRDVITACKEWEP